MAENQNFENLTPEEAWERMTIADMCKAAGGRCSIANR